MITVNKVDLIRNIIFSLLSVQDRLEDVMLHQNFLKLTAKQIDFKMHSPIVQYITDHSETYDSVPSIPQVLEAFSENPELYDELKKITGWDPENPTPKVKIPLRASNFERAVHDLLNEQIKSNIVKVLKEVSQISTSGLELKQGFKKVFLQGPIEAVDYAYEQLGRAIEPLHEGLDIMQETLPVDLERIHNENKESLTGLPLLRSGFDYLDFRTNGFRKKSLVMITAYTGELKSTTALNMMYNQFIEQKAKIEYLCLEMTKEEMVARFISIHSANEKIWGKNCLKLPINKIDDYLHGNDQIFNKKEKERYLELTRDLEKREGYFHFEEGGQGMTVSKIRKHLMNVQIKKDIELDAVYVDHGELLNPAPEDVKESHVVKLSKILIGLRQLSMNFNKKKGIRVFVPYQTNRDGYGRAKSGVNGAEGIYDLSALSWSSEAARSASTILSVYYGGEFRVRNEAVMTIIKTRGPGAMESFKIGTDLSHGRMFYKGIYKKLDELDLESFDSRQKKVVHNNTHITADSYQMGLSEEDMKKLNI
jgi:replicative DNA helicase